MSSLFLQTASTLARLSSSHFLAAARFSSIAFSTGSFLQ
jgi:hypothetical protein